MIKIVEVFAWGPLRSRKLAANPKLLAGTPLALHAAKEVQSRNCLSRPGVAIAGISRGPMMVRRNCSSRKKGQLPGSVGPGTRTRVLWTGGILEENKGQRGQPQEAAFQRNERRSHGTGKRKDLPTCFSSSKTTVVSQQPRGGERAFPTARGKDSTTPLHCVADSRLQQRGQRVPSERLESLTSLPSDDSRHSLGSLSDLLQPPFRLPQ